MYHFVVRRKLRAAFRDINAGRYERVVSQFSASHRHVMYGTHPLAGERASLSTTGAWYARLQRLLPDLRFDIEGIAVAGWPWDTLATVAWRDTFTLPDGERGSNQGVHVFRLSWGKVRSLVVHCDTAKLERYCGRLLALGVSEAGASPIA